VDGAVTGSAIAVGVFDGLHRGHLQILERALARARARDDRCVVVSFDPHPDVVLSTPFQAVAPLMPHAERRRRLSELGIEIYEVIPFTRELASLEPEDFVDRYLIHPFAMRNLVVGENFALGRGRAGNVERLRGIGKARNFEVEAVPLLVLDGAPVSSSRIRALLAEGRVKDAAVQLGRRYALQGLVVSGEGVGRQLGVPTANIRLHEEKLLPADGVYAAWARIDGDPTPHAAALSIGTRPTFGENARVIEAHLLGWSGELLERELEVELVDWLRGQEAFDGPDALVTAMQADLAAARQALQANPQITPEPAPNA